MSITIEFTPEQEAQLQIEAEKRSLNSAEYIRTVVVERLTMQSAAKEPRQRSILELEGIGAELWKNIDVEKYINDSRDEWDRQP